MPDWTKNWWVSLDSGQRTIVIVTGSILLIGGIGFVLGTKAFMNTDYSGYGNWLQSWFR